MTNPGDTLMYSDEAEKLLHEIGNRAAERDLLHEYVTVQGSHDHLYLQGFLLDHHGIVMAVVSKSPVNPFCRLVHHSRILELCAHDPH